MVVLTINPGSSSLKYALIEVGEQPVILERHTTEDTNIEAAVHEIISAHTFDVVSCRVVHGGDVFDKPVRVTANVLEKLRPLNGLAPLHNPVALEVLHAVLSETETPLIAVFDTAFHQTMSETVKTYPIDQEVAKRYGIQKYGFHGTAHKAATALLEWKLGEHSRPRKRLISCQIGGGVSICAVHDRKSVDTTMGFTPIDGVMMATRSGAIDPGIITLLLRNGWEVEEIEDMLQHRSGLQAIAGAADPRVLLERSGHGDHAAELALDMYCLSIAKGIASMCVTMGGVDGISFSGGIGQNSADVRARICAHLGFLGVILNPNQNVSTENLEEPVRLDAEGSAVAVWAIPTNEEVELALVARELL